MRENLYITISDIKGSKHYTVNQIIKKYLLIFVGVILGIFFILSSTIYFLSAKSKEYSKLKKDNYELTKVLGKIKNDISSKEMELDNLNEKLTSIEEMIDSEALPDTTIEERVNLAMLTTSEREYLMSVIPSGNPIEPFTIYTSKFGSRIHPTLKTRKNHWGLDFRAKVGTNIIAPAEGIVKFAGRNGGFGNLIIISHNYGFETYYAHLSKIDVKVGSVVTKGQLIAKSGNTGRSSGPHLHYEIHYLGKKLNPINFAKWNIKEYNTLFEKEKSIKWQSLISLARKQQQAFQIKEQLLLQTAQKSKETL